MDSWDDCDKGKKIAEITPCGSLVLAFRSNVDNQELVKANFQIDTGIFKLGKVTFLIFLVYPMEDFLNGKSEFELECKPGKTVCAIFDINMNYDGVDEADLGEKYGLEVV